MKDADRQNANHVNRERIKNALRILEADNVSAEEKVRAVRVELDRAIV